MRHCGAVSESPPNTNLLRRDMLQMRPGWRTLDSPPTRVPSSSSPAKTPTRHDLSSCTCSSPRGGEERREDAKGRVGDMIVESFNSFLLKPGRFDLPREVARSKDGRGRSVTNVPGGNPDIFAAGPPEAALGGNIDSQWAVSVGGVNKTYGNLQKAPKRNEAIGSPKGKSRPPHGAQTESRECGRRCAAG